MSRLNQARPVQHYHSPSSPSNGSDKENPPPSRTSADKGKGRAMGPPEKRKRGMRDREREPSVDRSQRRRTVEVNEEDEALMSPDAYDPDQDAELRRSLRGDIRNLSNRIDKDQSELLKPASTGIRDILLESNALQARIKQTSDAAIGSRLLVSTADLAKKKAEQMTNGDSSFGVDVDDFVSKLKLYMRRAGEPTQDHMPSQTQRNRRNPGADEDDEDDGEMLNWEHLGRFACVPNNSRPAVTGFLLGPLSVQKKSRKVTVRRAAFKPSNLQETRPEVLQAGDIEKREETNTTTLTMKILAQLRKAASAAMEAADGEHEEHFDDAQDDAILDKHGINRAGQMNFFKFVINPHSFGQTVENYFFVSFLIREGHLGMVQENTHDTPFLNIIEPDEDEQPRPSRKDNAARHQAILSIDMDVYDELISLYEITESMIPHRKEIDHSRDGQKGWYA